MITGNLARTPFAHLILYIREHGLSGTLAMWPAGTSDDPVVLGDTRDLADRLFFAGGVRKTGRIVEGSSTLERGLLPLFQRVDGPFIFYPDADYVGDGAGGSPPGSIVGPSLRPSARVSSTGWPHGMQKRQPQTRSA